MSLKIDDNCDYAMIGGGISGLATAWYLHQAGLRVRLLEKEATVGGCTRTIRQDGFLLEQGPFNVLVRDPTFEKLLCELGDDIEVEQPAPAAKIRYLYLDRRLVALPTGPLGLITSDFLSAGGKLRLLAEPFCARKSKADDPTIADFAARHFGKEFAQNVMGALVAGIFAGDAERLSLRACFPAIAQIDRGHRSLVLYGLTLPFRRIGKPKRHRRKWKGLVNFKGGLGAVTGALGRRLGDSLSTRAEVSGITDGSDGYTIEYTGPSGPERLKARGLILATAAPQTASLIEGLDSARCGKVVELLRSISSVPLVVLNLGFSREDIGHDLKGFGFLVPPDQPGISVLGVLWASSIFSSHAPDGSHLLRVFVGGARNPELTEKSDEELVDLVCQELGDLLEIRGRPTLVNTCRYKAAIPQYCQNHTDVAERIENHLVDVPNLHLVGNYLDGVSINDCVRLARKTADRILGLGVSTDNHSGR